MRHRWSVALVPLVVLLAGCGSSASTATATPTPLPKVDAICLGYDNSINALTPPYNDIPNPVNASELPAIATWLDKVLASVLQEQAALKAEPGAASLMSTFANVVATLQAMDNAAKGTDLAAYKTAYTNYVNANQAFSSAGQAAHLPDCG